MDTLSNEYNNLKRQIISNARIQLNIVDNATLLPNVKNRVKKKYNK